MTPDQRVEIAREYLAAARQRDPNHMPPSRLMAEVAETRRLLGSVLAVIDGQGVTLTPEVPDSLAERVARLAAAMTADASATPPGADAWTAKDVMHLALIRGLDVLEQRYLTGSGT
jgi:hypothetical protein